MYCRKHLGGSNFPGALDLLVPCSRGPRSFGALVPGPYRSVGALFLCFTLSSSQFSFAPYLAKMFDYRVPPPVACPTPSCIFCKIIYCISTAKKKGKDRRDGKSRHCCLLAALYFFHYDEFEECRMKATWRNGCLEKMDDHLVLTIPYHHPTKIDVLPQKFLFETSLLQNG